MLGVTSFLSTDVAAIPLFWVIPLALYLLSFIIVFARVPALVHRIAVLLLPLSMLALFLADFSDIGMPKWTVFCVHLANFFLVCMVCHGEIARTRPAAAHLTEFYLWLSVGGVLGGIFNSLIAPVAFTTVFEYPLVLILGALLLPAGRGGDRAGFANLAGDPPVSRGASRAGAAHPLLDEGLVRWQALFTSACPICTSCGGRSVRS